MWHYDRIYLNYFWGNTNLTKREELDLFLEKADELIDSKYILADIKMAALLRAIASSDTLMALFKNCLTDFDFQAAKKKYLVKSQFLSQDKGEFVLPPNSRELLAFVLCILVDIDAKNLDLSEFINKYFFEDGSFSSGYEVFVTAMIKPFRNSVKLLMESVLDGKLQDPVEALSEEEAKKAKLKEEEEKAAQKEKDLGKKSYATSVKAIKEILLGDKQKIKASKKKVVIKNDIILIIDMLANVIESEDRDAIEYAFTSYKYMTKAHPIDFYGRVNKISKLIRSILNGI